MTGEQLKLLSKMKKLVVKGDRKFLIRKDRDYIGSLLEIGISEKEAWNQILTLCANDYYPDYKPFYSKDGNALTFKKHINGYLVYIKLKIEEYNNNETTLCLSFHIDGK